MTTQGITLNDKEDIKVMISKSKTYNARKEYRLYIFLTLMYAISYKSYDIKTVSDDFLVSYVVISSSCSMNHTV